MLIIMPKFNWYIFNKFLTLLLKCTLVATFNNKVVQFKLLELSEVLSCPARQIPIYPILPIPVTAQKKDYCLRGSFLGEHSFQFGL